MRRQQATANSRTFRGPTLPRNISARPPGYLDHCSHCSSVIASLPSNLPSVPNLARPMAVACGSCYRGAVHPTLSPGHPPAEELTMDEQVTATTEIIAEFASAAEANEALERLRAAGIEGTVTGDVPTAPNFAIVDPQQFVPITVAVAPADVERAQQVLA